MSTSLRSQPRQLARVEHWQPATSGDLWPDDHWEPVEDPLLSTRTIGMGQWGPPAINPRTTENNLLDLLCLTNKVGPVVMDTRLVFQLSLPGTPAKPIKGAG